MRVVAADRNPAVEVMSEGDEGVVGLAGDVTNAEYAGELVHRAESTFGPVDLLVHSAGVMPGGQIAAIQAEQILTVMAVTMQGRCG